MQLSQIFTILCVAGSLNPGQVHGHRKRSTRTRYTPAEIQQLLDSHNYYRKKEDASDMEFMLWDDELANMAQDWSDRCVAEHGELENSSRWPFVGQNMFHSNMKNRKLTDSIRVWWEEIEFFNREKNKCEGGICGHYRQMVWSTSKYVGCGVTQCKPSMGGDIVDGDFVVCNYGPMGNTEGILPNKKGDPASQCPRGKSWGRDGLCDDCKGQEGCKCYARCWNCGTLDSNNCECNCAPGWKGSTCQEVCPNDPGCNGMESLCSWGAIKMMCPGHCGICQRSSGAQPTCPTPPVVN